jgi:hypothetical protein
MASDSVARALALAALNYKESHDKGDYKEIKNKPFLNNKMILGSHDANYYDLPMLKETANKIILSMSSEDYLLTAKLLNKDGEVISEDILDMPLEELVLDGRYEENSEGGWLVLTLKNGNEIRVPLSGLIDELATTEYVDFQDDYLEYKINSEGSRLETLILNEANMRSSEDEWIHELLVDHQEAIDAEIEARELGDSELAAKIENTKLDLQNLIDSEATLRLTGDSELRSLIDKEVEDREVEYTQLSASLDQEVANRTSEDDSIRTLIANNTSEFTSWLNDLNNSLNSEAQIRLENDSILSDRIDSEANKLDEEISLRAQGDSENKRLINNEANIRYNADQALSERINNMSLQADDMTIKKDSNNKLFVPIDYDTLSINAQGKLVATNSGGSTAIQSYLNGILLDSEATSISAKVYWTGTQAEYDALDSEAKLDPNTLYFVDASEGPPIIYTKSYYELEDKPSINGQVLSGNKTLSSLGIQPTLNGVNPISVGGNEVSLRYNESQFYIGSDNRLCYYDKVDDFEPNLVFADKYEGIYGGIKVNKYASGLYSGSIRFISLNALTAGTEYKVATSFGDAEDSITFNSYALGFDDLTYTPMCVKITNGEVYVYPKINIPARSVIGFTFIANN